MCRWSSTARIRLRTLSSYPSGLPQSDHPHVSFYANPPMAESASSFYGPPAASFRIGGFRAVRSSHLAAGLQRPRGAPAFALPAGRQLPHSPVAALQEIRRKQRGDDEYSSGNRTGDEWVLNPPLW